ncbi:MAG: outer membrane protein assembly factor, partial [Cytophagales bacterium]|nr:outer membrane protein assembly factor [Cytophagales bacterium]
GIYHTNPKIVYIPDDPRLGIYRTAFANTLCLYEERPSKNEGKIKSFGFAKKIKSTPDVAEYLEEDNDNEIDYPFVLRSRLFDMVLGDWDRHEDQWRWARFKNKNKGYTFRPIPRDRDQVFFVNQGLLPKIASRRWILPKFEGFNNDIRWEEGFNFNARFFDRSFLNQASLNDWLAQADSIQRRLTDEIIKQAIKESLPEKIYAINGETLVKKLIARRDKLKTVARNYYKALAKKVDVVGTSKNEQFFINRFDDGNVQITVRKISKKGKLKHITYQRLFKHNETKEVRLYGLGGKDEFKATGSSRKGVKVRVILKGKDNAFEDETTGAKSSQIKLYNVPEKESIRKGKSTKLKTLPRGALAEYNRRAFKYNQAFPLAAAGYNPDDKISLAAGTHIIAHAFNKEPYASSQTILAGVSLLGNAFSLKYKGDFTDFIGDFNLRIAADASVPSFISNYYGLGNSTSNKPDRVFNNKSSEMDFFRLRYMRILIDAGLHSKIGDRSQYTFGLRYLINEVFDNEYTDDKFIADFSENGLTPGEAYGAKEYGGLNFNYIYDHRNNPSLPESGFYFHLDASAYQRLGKNRRLAKIESDLSLYWTVRLPLRLTFATRFGSAVNFGGNYNFNMYNKLGGSKNLRGYRKDRFYGQSMFFNNIDLRLRLLNIHSSILPMTLGVIGFNDVGRVWLSGEKSKKWHWGYGGGIYVAPLNIVAFSLFSGFSEEGTNIYAKIGFSF